MMRPLQPYYVVMIEYPKTGYEAIVDIDKDWKDAVATTKAAILASLHVGFVHRINRDGTWEDCTIAAITAAGVFGT